MITSDDLCHYSYSYSYSYIVYVKCKIGYWELLNLVTIECRTPYMIQCILYTELPLISDK